MPRRRPAIASVALVLAAATLAACGGGPPADLFLVTRTGTVPGARLTVLFIDDGAVSCNGGPRRDITSEQLIAARELRRELDGEKDSDDPGLAEKHLDLPPGRITTMSYRVRSENGTVAFSDTSAHQPQAFYKIAKLTRDVAQDSCRLAR